MGDGAEVGLLLCVGVAVVRVSVGSKDLEGIAVGVAVGDKLGGEVVGVLVGRDVGSRVGIREGATEYCCWHVRIASALHLSVIRVGRLVGSNEGTGEGLAAKMQGNENNNRPHNIIIESRTRERPPYRRGPTSRGSVMLVPDFVAASASLANFPAEEIVPRRI